MDNLLAAEMPRDAIQPSYAPGGKAPSEEVLAEAVSRIRSVVEPEHIFLFGSAGRGEMECDSDLDFLIVVDPKKDEYQYQYHLYSKIRRQLHADLFDDKKKDLGFPVDVIVTTPQDMQELGPCPATVQGAALEEGKLLYEHQE